MAEEYYAFRIITQIKNIFIKYRIPIFLHNYRIIIITEDSGLVETVVNTMSVHKIKETHGTLKEYYTQTYSSGDRDTRDGDINNTDINTRDINTTDSTTNTDINTRDTTNSTDISPTALCDIARNNFLYSLVGYSLIQYLLSIKDRHNANILIDEFGHMIHIDFGYILGRHPGIYGVESAPFKFSMEYLDLVDLEEFRGLFKEGFICLHNNRSVLPEEIREKLEVGENSIEEYCDGLISKSVGNFLTVLYDQFQYYQNGYK